MVNKGIDDRGFIVCPDCGRTEPVFGPGFPRSELMKGGSPRQHRHPLEQGKLCNGIAQGPYFLGHQFLTDVLLIQLQLSAPLTCDTGERPDYSGRPARTALTSLAEAICLAASRRLQIDEGELAGNWSPVLGDGRQAQIFLYDLLPGGAGYTRMVEQDIIGVLEETELLLSACDCESSCYRCLRHYGNKFIHSLLDRHLALDLLRYITTGKIPMLTDADKRKSLMGLAELCKLKGMKTELHAARDNVLVPMVVSDSGGVETWIDVHHPLIDTKDAPSHIESIAKDEYFLPFESVEAFSLIHDLPRIARLLDLG
jgi:hypothetical protein